MVIIRGLHWSCPTVAVSGYEGLPTVTVFTHKDYKIILR